MRERLLKDEVDLLRGEKAADYAGFKGSSAPSRAGSKRGDEEDVRGPARGKVQAGAKTVAEEDSG